MKKKKGLAMVSKEKRTEIATKGGKASAKKYGKEFYQKIGAMGGKKTAQKGKKYMSNLAKKGYKAMVKSTILKKLDK